MNDSTLKVFMTHHHMSLPGLPWRIPGRTIFQSNFWSYEISTCAHALQPSYTACSNTGNHYDWGFYDPDAYGTVGIQSLTYSYKKPLWMYQCNNCLEMTERLQVFWFETHLASCYLLPPWWT